MSETGSAEPGHGRPTTRFRPSRSLPRLTAEASAREGRIVRLAFERFGADDARDFLNTFDATLGGRPLALAAESDAGALIVEGAIGERPPQVRKPADATLATANP